MITTTRRQLMAALILTGATGAACAAASGTPEPSPSGGVAFSNPVVDANVPDPMIIADDEGGWWVFATNGN